MLTKPHWRARDKARSTQMRARDASRAELATNVSDGSIADRRLESRRRFVRTCGCFSSIEVDVSAGLRPNSAARGSQPACRSRAHGDRSVAAKMLAEREHRCECGPVLDRDVAAGRGP